MKLAILIGASKDTLESPLVPLAEGKHRFHITGLSDSKYHIVYEDNKREPLTSKTVIDGDRKIKLQQVSKGTEGVGSICVYSEVILKDEEDNGIINI